MITAPVKTMTIPAMVAQEMLSSVSASCVSSVGSVTVEAPVVTLVLDSGGGSNCNRARGGRPIYVHMTEAIPVAGAGRSNDPVTRIECHVYQKLPCRGSAVLQLGM